MKLYAIAGKAVQDESYIELYSTYCVARNEHEARGLALEQCEDLYPAPTWGHQQVSVCPIPRYAWPD